MPGDGVTRGSRTVNHIDLRAQGQVARGPRGRVGGAGRGTKPEKPVDGIGAADGAITPGSAQGDRVHATDASSAHAAGGPSITCAAPS